jgi:hypothetical protein
MTLECQWSSKPTQWTSKTENMGYKMHIIYFNDVKHDLIQ